MGQATRLPAWRVPAVNAADERISETARSVCFMVLLSLVSNGAANRVKQENGGVKFLAVPEVGEIETDRLGRNTFWMANVRGDKPRGTLEGGVGIRITGKRGDAARGETEIVGFRVNRTPAA